MRSLPEKFLKQGHPFRQRCDMGGWPHLGRLRRCVTNLAAAGSFWCGVAVVSQSLAAPPPPGSEDAALMAEFFDWITTQRSAEGLWCCDMSDGRPLFEGQWKTIGGGYQVFISRRHWPDAPEPGVWLDVPPERVTAASPLGLPVAWWSSHAGRLWCFAPVGGF